MARRTPGMLMALHDRVALVAESAKVGPTALLARAPRLLVEASASDVGIGPRIILIVVLATAPVGALVLIASVVAIVTPRDYLRCRS